MYFDNTHILGEVAMMLLYGALFIFWLYVFAEILVSRNASSSILRYSRFRLISISFLVLAFLLFTESLYWALATAGRIGILPNIIERFFYFSWHVFTVKSLILVAGVVFLILFRKTHNYLEGRFSSLYFTQFLDSSIDAVGVLDKNGKVLFWNKGAEELFGFSREETVGINIKSFLVPERYLGHLSHVMSEIQESDRPKRFSVLRKTRTQGELEVDITMTPFRDRGEFAGYFGIMRPTNGSEVVDNFDYPEVNLNNPEFEAEVSTETIEKSSQNNKVIHGSVTVIMLLIVSLVFLFIAYVAAPPVQGYAFLLLGICITSTIIPTIRISKAGVNAKELGMKLVKALFEKNDDSKN
ncbi:MAG: PAS domain-containing protein [Pseudomonadota bacterium]